MTVTVTGTPPQLVLNAGNVCGGHLCQHQQRRQDAHLQLHGGSQQAASDLDYTAAGLELNGATIDDSSSNAVSLTLPATGSDGLATRDIAVGPFYEDFTSGTFSKYPWQLSAAGPSASNWTVAANTSPAGSFTAQSGAIGATGSSTLSITLTEAVGGEFSFWPSVAPASAGGLFSFEITSASSSTTLNQWSGATPWQESFYGLLPGQYTLSWIFSNAAAAAAGSVAG